MDTLKRNKNSEDKMDTELKTGTTTVGIVCKDGLILAADRRATSGYLVVNKRAKKVFKITEKMALTTAGNVSDIQLQIKLIKAEMALKKVRTGREPTIKETANLLGGLIYSNIRRMSLIPGISRFILAGADNEGLHMYDLFADGSVTDVDDYNATGSGSITAYGVFEALYKKDLTIKEGIKLAVKALNAALQRDIASGNGIDVVTITGKGVEFALEQDIDSTIKE